MPHIVVEYTANLKDEASVPDLLREINATVIAQGGVFPTGGIRSRAIALADWCIADGTHPDDGFVHVSMKIGAGRTPEQKKRVADAVFDVVKAHYAAAFARRGLALSLELAEFDEAGTWKHNNLHARYRKA